MAFVSSKRRSISVYAALLFAAIAPSSALFAAEPADGGELRWWKGNIHTHSLWSDGNDFPEMIADWYKQPRLPLPRPVRPQHPQRRRALDEAR